MISIRHILFFQEKTEEQVKLKNKYYLFAGKSKSDGKCNAIRTYLRNHDSELLDYGHNKRGKNDLYQINISLCCNADSGILFFHKSYAGNYNDKQFIHEYVQELRQQLNAVGCNGKTLLIVDRGINGKSNFDLLLNY